MHRSTGEPTSNMSKTSLQQQITVHALPSKVWKVLTAPEYLNQYCIEESIQSEWVEGSAIRTHQDSSSSEIAVGRVLDAVPGLLLKFSLAEKGQPRQVVTTYELMVAGEGVELKLKCEGFQDSQQEFNYRIQQSRLILQKIKWLSEFS